MMQKASILQRALGENWQSLPAALQSHYCAEDNADVGELDIEYPRAMQWFLNILYVIGALLNRRGRSLPTRVEKRMDGDRQEWQREIRMPDGNIMHFSSTWINTEGNRIVEFVNPLMGLCMAVHLDDGELHYEGQFFVINLFGLHIPVPEWLLLGHTQIVEKVVDAEHFEMDFRLIHPLFGEVYRYAGKFKTVKKSDER